MITAYAVTHHFQCSFELRPAATLEEPWTELVKTLRHWVSTAPRNCPPKTNPAFYAAWFFNGGEWRDAGSDYHYVRTVRMVGEGSDRDPAHWALRYEHNCEMPDRVWRIDVGLSRLGDRAYRLSMVTSYYLRPGFIGHEPPSPVPTAPNLIAWLLQSDEWNAFAGSEKLHAKPQVLHPGDGEKLRARLEDQARECPIIVISCDFSSGDPLVDAMWLAKLLGGSATVYRCESSELDKELEWCLGRRFSCWNGMVRVYQPGLRFDNPRAPKRQRYFSGRDIMQHGQDAVVDMLVHGVARRAQRRPSNVVASVEDVQSVEREHRMAALRAAATDRSSEEWIELLEATNEELEATKKSQETAIQQLKNDLADRDERVARLDFDKKAIIAKNSGANKESRILRQQTSVLSGLSQLPESTSDVVSLIEQLHPDRIAFTERAKKSAAGCRSCRPNDAWRCFWAMATTLHDIFFADGDRPGNIEEAFLDSSGFYLAMTEGELTKADRKLMSSRRDTFGGSDIDITPHVKLDKDATRAYFCPFSNGDSKLIVVGHIGHLKTAGTRRRKD